MADPIQLPEPLRQIVDANLGYYRALGRVTADYVKALGQVWTDAAAAAIPGLMGATGATPRASGVPVPGQAAAATALAPASAQPALLLEAEAGQSAQAVFMVDNGLPRTVSATVETSEFGAADGRSVRPPLRVQPGTVTLEPGGRTLVQLTAVIDDTLEPGVSYRGHVAVPGLSDRPVPVILRRRLTAAPAVAPAGAEAAAPRAARPRARHAGGKPGRPRGNGTPPKHRK